MDYPLLPPEGVLYEVGKYARSVRLRRTAPLLFVFSGSLCFRREGLRCHSRSLGVHRYRVRSWAPSTYENNIPTYSLGER